MFKEYNATHLRACQGSVRDCDQGDNSFHVYDAGTNRHLGRFVIGDQGLVDGVSETDGIKSVDWATIVRDGLY